MDTRYFQPFEPKKQAGAVNVLTIAAAFPSLIQPWLVNHLVQVIRHGGDNRIISRREETDVFTDAIVENGLLSKYCRLGDDKMELLKFYFQQMRQPSQKNATRELLRNYDGASASLKQKVFDRFCAPAFSVKPDIIHCHSEPAGNSFIRLIKANNAPLVITFHGLPPVGVTPLTPQQRKNYVGAAEAIFVNTDFAKRQYMELGAPEEKFIIVPQGIELARWPFSARPFPQDEKVRLLTVGRLHPDKGHKYALDAVKSLVELGHDIHYTIVGNGPEKDAIAARATELGIRDRIEIFSGIPDKQLEEIYRRSHIFVLPSLRSKDGFHEETQGVVLQEAQATGLITIATKSGGIPECIDDGVSGFLVDDRNAPALADMIQAVINRKAEWVSIQEKGRQWVETHYAADVIGQRMNGYYRDIAGLA